RYEAVDVVYRKTDLGRARVGFEGLDRHASEVLLCHRDDDGRCFLVFRCARQSAADAEVGALAALVVNTCSSLSDTLDGTLDGVIHLQRIAAAGEPVAGPCFAGLGGWGTVPCGPSRADGRV